jgi:hypothetical protein
MMQRYLNRMCDEKTKIREENKTLIPPADMSRDDDGG